MDRESRKRKRKNRLHRWLAMALTVAMLAGQGKVDVWAQEGADDVPPAAESSEEIKTDAANGSGAEDNNSDPDQDDENNGGAKDQDTEDDNSPAKDQEPEEGKNMEENSGTENHNPEDGGQENTEGNEDGQDMCVCDTRCTEEAVNVDCPVCAVDYADCIGKEAEEVLPETVTENTLDGETDIAVLADEDVEAYAVGATFTYDGITYVVTEADEVEVGRQDTDVISGAIVIPETFEKDGVTYRVTGIGEEAFYLCVGLTSIKIPRSVTSIGKLAFKSCIGMTSVEMPDSVTAIGEEAFNGCYQIRNIEIPGNVKSIEPFAFSGCRGLTSLRIPAGVERIGEGAFYFCSGITSVEIPNSVTSIELSAFQQCTSLTGVEIPDSVTSIGESVFYYCTSLTSAVIPNNVTSISGGMFHGCRSLTSVKIPDGVTVIENCAFAECRSLTSIEIPDGVTSIDDIAFSDCSGLTSIEIPDSVTNIGEHAFFNCSGLTSVTLSENITEIDSFAFRNCGKLKEMRMVVLSDGKIRFPAVGQYAFDGLPDERYLIFVDGAGNELTGETLEAAQNAFLDAAKSDGSDDGRWYGWMVRGLSYRPGSGDNGNPGGGSTTSGSSGSGNSAGNMQVTLVSEMASVPVENGVTESADTTQISGGQEADAVALVSEGADVAEGISEQSANKREPKTGDATHVEIYATIAMIAGLAYLLLYFMEEGRGMTEREKEVFMAAFIRWGRKGGMFRKGCAIVAIFCLLVYYHAVGKYEGRNAFRYSGCNPS